MATKIIRTKLAVPFTVTELVKVIIVEPVGGDVRVRLLLSVDELVVLVAESVMEVVDDGDVEEDVSVGVDVEVSVFDVVVVTLMGVEEEEGEEEDVLVTVLEVEMDVLVGEEVLVGVVEVVLGVEELVGVSEGEEEVRDVVVGVDVGELVVGVLLVPEFVVLVFVTVSVALRRTVELVDVGVVVGAVDVTD